MVLDEIHHFISRDSLEAQARRTPEVTMAKGSIMMQIAVEHVLGMLAAGDTSDTIIECYLWLEREDILACLAFARRLVGRERVEPLIIGNAA